MSDIDKHIPSMGPDRGKNMQDVEEDPDNDGSSAEQDLPMPQMVIAMGDDSNEEEDSDDDVDDGGAGPGGDGYMLLPDADQEIDHADIEAMDEEAHGAAPSSQQQQQQPELPTHLAKLLPTQPPTQDPSTVVSFADTSKTLETRRQVMAADDEIQKAMAGFSLPGTAIPPWARAQGDKEWKDQLAEMIRGREEKRHETGGTSKDGKT
ncbi:male-enhanced antigen 1-like [Patiria miniata]|uniref:Male-enhanced antigen 1 n=1 Tax=Patiria miniata TaxID=46514 RepID=A0A913ZLC4_PATMI|nr:male-enhanced antigen 1-like [Patiria miniata]